MNPPHQPPEDQTPHTEALQHRRTGHRGILSLIVNLVAVGATPVEEKDRMPCTNLVTVDGVVVMTAEDNSYKGRDAARPARGGALAHAELEEVRG